jgi:hypothetical protein
MISTMGSIRKYPNGTSSSLVTVCATIPIAMMKPSRLGMMKSTLANETLSYWTRCRRT